MGEAGFWDNQETAQQLVVELKQLKTIVSPIEDLDTASADLVELLEMGEDDPEIAAEVTIEIDRLEMLVNELELKSMLSGPHDHSGAIMTIN
ncbi:MAG: PCRF domain-containing protein, partial [Planctomycetaceae bacterium]|nr:PCRF domain-containing protein [Planctomycetaceae bacterium]